MWVRKPQAQVTFLKLMTYSVMDNGARRVLHGSAIKVRCVLLGEGQDILAPVPSPLQWGWQLPALGRVGQADTGAGDRVSHNPGEHPQ